MKKVLSIIVSLMLIVSPVYALDSEGVIYDNSTSGSSATNVNDALNDLYSKLNEKQTEINTIKNIGNATSDKILSGYTAYVKGNTITGSIPSKGATTYTPGTSNQTIASGQYLSNAQTIKGDANLVAANIAKGKSIFGINGTYTSDATATSPYIVNGKTAYVNGSKVTGTLPNRSCASCGASGVVGLNSDIWSNVAVSPFDGALHWQINTDGVKRLNLQVPYGVYGGSGNPGGLNGDGYVGIEVTRFGNATTSQVLNTATFTSENGMSIKGSIPNKGAATYTPGTSNQTIASGQYLSGVQTIKGDSNLVAGNIKKGVSIFGVTGNFEEDYYRAKRVFDFINQHGYNTGEKLTAPNFLTIQLGKTVNITATNTRSLSKCFWGWTTGAQNGYDGVYYEGLGESSLAEILDFGNATITGCSRAIIPITGKSRGLTLLSTGIADNSSGTKGKYAHAYTIVLVY